MDTSRIVVRDAQDAYLFDLAPSEVYARTRTEELNGPRTLSLATPMELEQGWRVLTVDATGKWREYVVAGADGGRDSTTYRCVWSLQHDLLGVTCEAMPGTRTPVSATEALAALLTNTSRWAVGTVDVGTTGGASFYNLSAYKALGRLVEVWGGEVDAEIAVQPDGAVARAVALRAHIGSSQAVRRFDYGADMTGIRRKVVESPAYCRIKPLGKGEETEGGGYGRKITIESVNDGKDYLENSETAPLRRLPKPGGGWEYPTVIVENAEMETPADLKAWAEGVLDQYTTPKVSYSADVVQLAEAGMDAHGVGLGDECQCVDRGFGGDGLRISGRIVKITVDELDQAAGTSVTIGNITETIASKFKTLGSKLDRTAAAVDDLEMTTQEYFDNIVDNLNQAINATGGYTYITEGQGIRTYDRAVSDPLVGTEATKVVEVKGGSIRIADSKTSQGEWEWKTVFVSGHVAAELITAVAITAGFIGSAASGNYWNLDTGTLYIGGKAAPTAVDDASKVATNYLTYSTSNGLDVGYSGTSAKTRINGSGVNVYDGNGASALYAGLSGGNTIVRVGKAASPHATIDTEGMTVYDGSETAANVAAKFGTSGAQIGKSADSHISMDYHSMSFVDKEGTKYFQVADMRDATGYATLTETIVASGSSNAIDVAFVISSVTSVKVGSSTATGYTFSGNSVLLATTPSAGTKVVVVYKTSDRLAKAYTVGERKSGSIVGAYSVAEGYNVTAEGNYSSTSGIGTKATGNMSRADGYNTTASGQYSHSEGSSTTASGRSAHAEGASTQASGDYSHSEGSTTHATGTYAHAEGSGTYAEGDYSHAEGRATEAVGAQSSAHGWGTVANGTCQAVFGRYNVKATDSYLLVGRGTNNSSRADAMRVMTNGNMWIAGTLTQASDRRLKEHHAYLGEDAAEFVRALKPAIYTKDGTRHLGFYAQDVREAEPEWWDSATVTETHTDESLGFDPLALDYTALIAPLVAYTQSLERRIAEIEAKD